MTSKVSKADPLRDYLLGRLSESEQERLERRLLLEDRLFQMGDTLAQSAEERAALEDELRSLEGASDEEVEEREQALRAELFDAHARGELSPEDRRWVSRWAESGEDRERLAFAHALARETAGARTWIWRPAAAIAATVALTFGIFGYYAFHRWHDAARLQAALGTGARSVAAPLQTTAVAVIPWSSSRGEEPQEPQRPIQIPRTAARIDFQLILPPSADRYTTFEVTIRDPGDRLLDTLPKIGKNPDQNLHFQLGAEKFQDGVYAFQVSGLRADGERKDLGTTQAVIRRS